MAQNMSPNVTNPSPSSLSKVVLPPKTVSPSDTNEEMKLILVDASWAVDPIPPEFQHSFLATLYLRIIEQDRGRRYFIVEDPMAHDIENHILWINDAFTQTLLTAFVEKKRRFSFGDLEYRIGGRIYCLNRLIPFLSSIVEHTSGATFPSPLTLVYNPPAGASKPAFQTMQLANNITYSDALSQPPQKTLQSLIAQFSIGETSPLLCYIVEKPSERSSIDRIYWVQEDFIRCMLKDVAAGKASFRYNDLEHVINHIYCQERFLPYWLSISRSLELKAIFPFFSAFKSTPLSVPDVQKSSIHNSSNWLNLKCRLALCSSILGPNHCSLSLIANLFLVRGQQQQAELYFIVEQLNDQSIQDRIFWVGNDFIQNALKAAVKNTGHFQYDGQSFGITHIHCLARFIPYWLSAAHISKKKQKKKSKPKTPARFENKLIHISSVKSPPQRPLQSLIASVDAKPSSDPQMQHFFIVEEPSEQDTKDHIFWIGRGLIQDLLKAIALKRSHFRHGHVEYELVQIRCTERFIPHLDSISYFLDTENLKTVYVYKHKLTNQEAYEMVHILVRCYDTPDPVSVEAYHAKGTDSYFINSASYQRLFELYGLPLFRITSISNMDDAQLRETSELMLYGYSVSDSQGLQTSARQRLLRQLIDTRLMHKSDIINHIEWLVNTHKYNSIYSNACSRWQEDLSFLHRYEVPPKTNFYGRLSPPKQT